MSALHDLPAHALLSAYRQRTLSPVEVVTDVLAHMERWEPHIRATYLPGGKRHKHQLERHPYTAHEQRQIVDQNIPA